MKKYVKEFEINMFSAMTTPGSGRGLSKAEKH